MGNTSSSHTSHGHGGNNGGNGGGAIHGSSTSNGTSISSTIHSLKRSTGSLGLSRSELEKRCKPTGLYASCSWDDKVIRKLIGDGRLSARVRGVEDESDSKHAVVECPICFLYYQNVNATDCCSAYICSECFLQLKPFGSGSEVKKVSDGPTSKGGKNSGKCSAQAGSDCPFCNNPCVTVHQCKGLKSKSVDEAPKPSKDKESSKRTRSSSVSTTKSPQSVKSMDTDLNTNDGFSDDEGAEKGDLDTPLARPAPPVFGQSLSRMTSFHSEGGTTSHSLQTAQDRERLEKEMKEQLDHPLMRQIYDEAQSASNARAAAHEQSSRNRRRNRFLSRYGSISAGAAGNRSSAAALWQQRASMQELYGREGLPSLNDLVMLEAVMMLSMEEEARQRENGEGDAGNGGGEATDNDASTTGMRESLLQALMARSGAGTAGDGSADSSDPEDAAESNNAGSSSLMDRAFPHRRRRRRYRASAAAENLALVGMTEEDQVAMAIALSLRESAPTESTGGAQETEGGEEDASQNQSSGTSEDPQEGGNSSGVN